MSIDGVVAVARQELTVRIRKGRWRMVLAAWFVVLFLFTWLLWSTIDNTDLDRLAFRGRIMFGGLMILVLALAMLVVPALAGQSVNGDRERGTLATLQVSRLAPLEITLGKFLAAWGSTIVFLLATLPLIGWCLASDGLTVGAVVVVLVVMTLLLGTVCAVALGLSALLARSTTSSVLSYLAVFALTLGTFIAFGLLGSTVASEKVTRQVRSFEGGPGVAEPFPGGPDIAPPTPLSQPQQPREVVRTETYRRARFDRVWPVLALNPVVVLADAAPDAPKLRTTCFSDTGSPFPCTRDNDSFDPLGGIGRAVRDVRRPPLPDCFDQASCDVRQEAERRRDESDGAPVWPVGLALNVLLAGGALAVTTARLRTPSRKLARGQRVA